MSKTVTLRLGEDVYHKFKHLAEDENRPLSNFIETAALRFVEEHEYVDGFEMSDIQKDVSLNRSIENGLRDAKRKRGSFV
jgi:predicted transcriptional regulator